MKDANNVLNGVQTVVFDLDGTIYDKSGLARRMVSRLWWSIPLLTAERLARRAVRNRFYGSKEAFYQAFFAQMAKGHWWTAAMAERWYYAFFMPAMIEFIRRYHSPRPEIIALIQEADRRGIRLAIFSDYGFVEQKLRALSISPDLFVLCTDAPSMGGLKPAVNAVKNLMTCLQADPLTTLFIGDRDDKDGASARVVGARFLLIPNS